MNMSVVTLPLWLVVSQWTLLFALGFLVIVMYRQVALLEKLKERSSEREGLPIGEKAPAFDYIPAGSSTKTSTRFEPTGTWSLLIFADPSCVSCQGTMLALERLAPQLGQTLRLLVVTTADPAQVAAVDAFRTASFDIGHIRSDVSSKLYRTNITPFAHVIDPTGLIRAKEIALEESSIRKIVRKVERNPINVAFTVS
jgi:hypothetical protein